MRRTQERGARKLGQVSDHSSGEKWEKGKTSSLTKLLHGGAEGIDLLIPKLWRSVPESSLSSELLMPSEGGCWQWVIQTRHVPLEQEFVVPQHFLGWKRSFFPGAIAAQPSQCNHTYTSGQQMAARSLPCSGNRGVSRE